MERGSRTKKKSSSGEKVKKPSESKESELGSREVTVTEPKEQYLFLLEFLVNHVTGDRLAKLNQMFFVPTSISINFLHFVEDETIEITPVDPLFQPQAGIADDVEYFYSGCSVLFAIDQRTVLNRILDFIVTLGVEKKMPEGVKPNVLIGTGQLDMSKHFAALRKEMLQCWHRLAPPPKCFEGEVPLMYEDIEVGTVCMFVRISAFGETIVTEFDAPPDMDIDTYVFRSNEVDQRSLGYKCRIVDSKNADIGADSALDLTGGPPCRVCVKEQHPCTPCANPCGATLKPNVSERQVGGSDGYPTTVSKSQSKPETCDDLYRNGGPIQSSRGQPCGKAVVLKVSGVLDTGANKKPTVTVASESEAADQDCGDPSHDVFVLRIGKKGIVGAGEKSDIQLEMRTPKGVEKGPPMRMETREMQTDEGKKRGKKKKKKKKKE
ncbi:PREDICTED: uncharacterized protein LOC107186470 [Dufourea novaeangliae]|uniref:Uncharacterized protein n=1 Tax=Dufourea novaeangliae TaxID=178035 RepID=A0A154P8X5_DUFNO|nr:PREDICTED: uncharacterized protein LOC107186470 [Dufourea novaeangliae]KZC08359.1 hypothetical protein WN55_09263 [Dufourea novaeangliae]